ncbi:MAG: VWA domain-containing protein [Gemmatimonadales bacterium]|jgi:Ca-activated chloride channel family protein|nr:VWA domain-containing protein [Gemmatimonadales bacterium]
MRFAQPALLLLLLLPLAGAWIAWRRRPVARLAFSALHQLRDVPRGRARWARLPEWLALLGLVALVLGLARPQLPSGVEQVTRKSRNIVVALDISSSMKATDFQPVNRVTAARAVLRDFVLRRDGDLVGLVIFAGKAFLQAPLTTDVALVGGMLDRADIGQVPDGTAIGTAVAMGLNQIKTMPAAASCVVVVTDGANNTGTPSLPQAIEAARALGVRIHAIGLTSADTTSVALSSVWTVRDRAARLSDADEKTLQRVAERTGGRYARATSPAQLDSLLGAIDELERQDVPVRESRRYRELFPWLTVLGLVLLAGDRALRASWLRTAP